MNPELLRRLEMDVEQASAEAAVQAARNRPELHTATAALVNRTHRIVEEQARGLRAKQRKVRSLWVPLSVFSGLLLVLCFTIWSILDSDDAISSGIPDASQQLLILLMWCLPITMLVLGVVLFRNSGTRASAGSHHGGTR